MAQVEIVAGGFHHAGLPHRTRRHCARGRRPPLPQDLTLVLPAEAAVSTAGEEVRGINITRSGEAITVTAAGSGIDTAGSGGAGIQISGWNGDVKVDAGAVTTTGDRSDGIAVDAGMSGNIAINADSVLTMGEASTGVTAVGTAIDVQIADTVRTSGDKATCIFARTNFVYRDTVTIPDTTWLAPGPRAASPLCLDLTD